MILSIVSIDLNREEVRNELNGLLNTNLDFNPLVETESLQNQELENESSKIDMDLDSKPFEQPALEEQLPFSEDRLDLEEQLPVSEDRPELEEQLPVSEDRPELEEQLPVSEDRPELEEQLPVSEDRPELEEQLLVSEDKSVGEYVENQEKTDESNQVREESPLDVKRKQLEKLRLELEEQERLEEERRLEEQEQRERLEEERLREEQERQARLEEERLYEEQERQARLEEENVVRNKNVKQD